MNPIISVYELEKHFKVAVRQRGALGAIAGLLNPHYRTVKAVDGVTFEIGRGELVGYLGPNGAGKSTTLKMLTGLLTPSSGRAVVNGYVPWRERQEYVAHIGAVFGQRTTLWWDLPVIESLDMLKYIYRIPDGRYHTNLKDFRKLLEMDEFINTPVRQLSLGQRMRADLCAALLHNPRLLFLDEPTIGLDVVAKERIREFIRHTNQQREVTVILTTHDLQDVEKLCERVMIIDQGRLLYDGALSGLTERFGGRRQLVVDFADDYPDVSVEGAAVSERQGRRATYQFERHALTAAELIARIAARYRIQDLSVKEPEIEETVRRIYEQKLLV
jgi:ABC-2 type transport system ATP-binding protein